MARQICRSIGQVARIVFLRFSPIPRVWALIVVVVNALAIVFAHTLYAQVVLVSVGVGVLTMACIHAKLGFVRLLGIGHALWIPMLPWLASELPNVDPKSALYLWLLCLIGINSICLIVDSVDLARYLAGERKPHYVWRGQSAE